MSDDHIKKRITKRRYNLRHRYGISLEEWEELAELQNWACIVCRVIPGPEDKPLVVDHDHSHCPGRRGCPECIQGLICSDCNHTEGMFGALERRHPEGVERMIEYRLGRGDE